METLSPLRGIIPPLVLPMAADGSIDMTSLGRQVEFLLCAGVHGLWVNGTTGEFFALEPGEREAVIREVVRIVRRRVPIIAQVGDASSRLALRHARAADAAGADYLAAVAPFYLDFSQAELRRYYRSLAAASSRPLIVYHLPQMTKVGLSIESIVELGRDGSVVAIKDSAGDLGWHRQLLHELKAASISLSCFVGGGNLIDISLLAGGHGAMCAIANLVPHQTLAIYRAALAGDWPGAARRQQELQALIAALRLPTRTNWAPTIAVYKWVLREQGIIASDFVAEPLEPLTEDEQRWLREGALPLIRQFDSMQR